ncbi:MAG: glycosyltransferase family 4 protein [Candidatus Omnitrophica bacterium]|nr:glycosyltransferase family 4 protein [Candidatus Omnitrophota bacterium]MBU4479642.1 glycosyltransferase family 4 protein [Candidatus Omnitrophota bacterium]MCG2703529.1 glycosyltransferase family 4 protein [Candidatus Omnitrophota bacterium]
MATDINRKIRIAQIITRMDWGGAPDIVRMTCEGLDRNIYDITLVTGGSRFPTKKTKSFLAAFAERTVIIPYLKRDINPLFDLPAFFKLYMLFRQERFDIVHTHTAKAGMLGRLAARLAGVKKIVHTAHGHNFYGYFGRVMSAFIVFAERFASRFTDCLAVLTQLERNDLLRFKVARDEQIRVVHTAVEEDAFSACTDKTREAMRKGLNISETELIIGMVARLEAIKGVEYFVEAAILCENLIPPPRFLIVGDGSLRAALEEKVRTAGMTDRIVFTGWRNDALELMSAMDIVVLASLNEAVGLVLIEAQGLGIPVVATRVGGIPEIVEDNKSGILVEPANAAGLAEALRRLVEDKQKRTEMGSYAKQSVKNRYSATDYIEKISCLYNGLYENKKT